MRIISFFSRFIFNSMFALIVFGNFSFASPANSEDVDQKAGTSPIFGVSLPADYREWQFVSLAHEDGKIPDIRVILANDIALKAFKEGTLPFPDGAIIARLAYQHVSSAQNNAVFGREQSFIAGDPTNVQISVKDSKRYADTGGWGYGQFEDGKPNPSETLVNTCFACHMKLPPTTDLVFTKYSK